VTLDSYKVGGGSPAADHSIGLVGNWGLINNGIKYGRRNSMVLAPGFRKDVVDVEGNLLEVQLLYRCLPKEILGTLAQNEDIRAVAV
jgi:hypothetical protein